MTTSLSDTRLPERERANFAARCRRQGFCPEQFRISADAFYPALDALAPMSREISVTHVGYFCLRRYRTDHFSDWLDAFEDDLRNGFFYSWRDCECAGMP